MVDQETLKARQAAAQQVYDRMMTVMLRFDACEKLAVGDIKFIARMAQTHSFDAFEQVQS